jgi:hypothetical protein
MKRKLFVLLTAAALVTSASSSTEAAVLLSWNTAGNTGTETTEPSVSNDAGIVAAPLNLGPGVIGASNGNRFGGNNWFDAGNTAAAPGSTLSEAITGNNYIEFVVAPLPGFQFTATSFDFIWDRSSTGPAAVALRSSFDSFGADLGQLTGLPQPNVGTSTFSAIPITGLSDITSATTFRLYGFNTTAVTGTGGFDTVTGTLTPNVIFNGDVTAVPEPTSMALIGMFGVAGMAVRYRRKNASSSVAV